MLKLIKMNFKNKVIWITGASSGIGKSLAIELSNLDAKLILSSRNKTDLELVKSKCKSPEKVEIIPLDLEKYHDFSSEVQQAIACFGKIDILVNNGGISQRSLVENTIIDVDERIMNINFLGTIALTKALMPHFIENKSGHFVVTTNISINALTGNRNSQGKMDKATENGINPKHFANLMAKAIYKQKEEVYIAGFKEKLGVYLKRFYPKLLSKMIRKLAVT